MKCKHCQKDIGEDVVFCPHCGTKQLDTTPDVKVKEAENSAQIIAGLKSDIQAFKEQNKSNFEAWKKEQDGKFKEALADALALQKKEVLEATKNDRRFEFPVRTERRIDQLTLKEIVDFDTNRSAYEVVNNLPPANEFAAEVYEAQKHYDRLKLTHSLLNASKDHYVPIESLKAYDDFVNLYGNSFLKKALDTQTSGEGSEWIETRFSNRMVELYQLELVVASAFNQIPMITSPFTVPYQASRSTGYYVQESKENDSSNIRASKPGSGNVTFTARKIATRVVFSEELNEDSVFAVMPMVESDVAYALGIAIDKAIIDGDRDGTHQDSLTDTEDSRFAWHGLKRMALALSSTVSFGDAAPTAALMRDVRQAMGKYGVKSGQLASFVSANAYLKLLEDNDVRTVEKFGPQATVKTGEISRIDNIPILPTEAVTDLYDATGVGASSDRGIAITVWTPGYWIGMRKELTIRSEIDIKTDQIIVVPKTRLDFQPNHDNTTETSVAMGYNINAD